MLSKKNRIQNQRLIDKLGKEKPSYKTTHFVFKYLPSHLSDSKFAIMVSKKISLKAVTRNRLRRQIAESLRHHLDELTPSIVCLVIQKKGTPDVLVYNVIDTEISNFIHHFKTHV